MIYPSVNILSFENTGTESCNWLKVTSHKLGQRHEVFINIKIYSLPFERFRGVINAVRKNMHTQNVSISPKWWSNLIA